MSSHDEINFQKDLLAINRRNLKHYLTQAALSGGEMLAPLEVANGLYETRQKIQDAKDVLRSLGESVEYQAGEELSRAHGEKAFVAVSSPTTLSSLPEKVGKGLTALGTLIDTPQVRDVVIAFRADFRATCDHIQIIGGYKELHDLLHQLQRQFASFEDAARRLIRSKKVWDELEKRDFDIAYVISEAEKVAEIDGFASPDISWKQDLTEAREILQVARLKDDHTLVKDAIWIINRVITRWPTIINVRLTAAARDLRLPVLLERLTFVRDCLSDADLNPNLVHRFKDGVDALEKLNRDLKVLILDHDTWQDVDNFLRSIHSSPRMNMSDIKRSWLHLKVKMQPLYAGSTDIWREQFNGDSEKLENALIVQNRTKAMDYFNRCSSRANQRFFEVDKELKKQCGDLRILVGEHLSYLLGKIE